MATDIYERAENFSQDEPLPFKLSFENYSLIDYHSEQRVPWPICQKIEWGHKKVPDNEQRSVTLSQIS